MNVIELRRLMAQKLDEVDEIAHAAEREERTLTDDERTQVDALLAEAEQLKADAERAARRDGFNSPHRGPVVHMRPTADNPTAIMARYIRTGDVIAGQEMHAAAIEEYRASNDTAMNITTAGDGGYLVPTGHFQEIIARRDEMMLAGVLGVRDIPGVGTTVNVPIDDEADGEFVATDEQDDSHTKNFDRDAPAINRVQMTLVKYSKKIELTDELLQDNDSNLLPFLADWVGRGMARTHNQLLVTEVLANGTAGLTLDKTNDIAASEISELVYKLAQEYEDGAAWLMRRATEGIIRGKAGDAFQFAPTPGGRVMGSRRELWGFPAHTTQYMGATEASGKSLVFGNFRFVGKREAPGITLLRDPYTVDGMLVLKYYFRTVYKVLQAEAIQYAIHPTADA